MRPHENTLRLRRRSAERDHLMPADGVMEGGWRGVERLEIRTTWPNAVLLFLRRWFHFTSCLLHCVNFMLDFIKGRFLRKYSVTESGAWIIVLQMHPKDVCYFSLLYNVHENDFSKCTQCEGPIWPNESKSGRPVCFSSLLKYLSHVLTLLLHISEAN